MAEQLGLFAPRRAATPEVCPRVPGPLCRDGREGRCPGRERCEELGEVEAARLKRPTLTEVVAQANAELGEEADTFKLLKRAGELAAAPDRECGGCGSTTGVVLYERGPLSGMHRCWACAKQVLQDLEATP